MSLAIQTNELSYSFGRRKVVDAVSLQVPDGGIYGFLGPNGAGKTTTIRLLSRMLLSDKDNIFLYGGSLQKEVPQIFSCVGCLIETPSLYLHLTGRENLAVIATLRRLPKSRIDHVLRTVGMEGAANRKVKEYSLGMKQRLGIAMALMPDPKLLILDEPVNGLDPNGIIEIREMLIRINKEEGKTIFVSSHLLSEVEKTCTHIGIINRGKLRYQGTMDEMKNAAYASGEVVFRIGGPQENLQLVQNRFSAAKRQAHDELIFPFAGPAEVSQINQKLVAMEVPVNGIQIRGGLEDWFMNIIQQDAKPIS